MLSKFFILLSLASCGADVRLKENKLENVTPLTDAQLATYQKQGTLTKGQTTTVLHQSKTYTVSIYSSMQAQTFINSLPPGSSVPVIFTGGFKTNEVIIEQIQRR